MRRFLAALVVAQLVGDIALAAPPAAHAADKLAPPPKPSKEGWKSTAERWKGESPKPMFHVGAMTGAGFLSETAGLSVLGVAAVKVAHKGFLEDFTNQVFLEAEAGGLFVASQTFFQWNLQLRWDFVFDEYWTFYAVGGLGGVLGNNRSPFYPRFGIGAQWNLFVLCGIRAELTRDFIGAGVAFPL
jgi:hypothetical protein